MLSPYNATLPLRESYGAIKGYPIFGIKEKFVDGNTSFWWWELKPTKSSSKEAICW